MDAKEIIRNSIETMLKEASLEQLRLIWNVVIKILRK
jgi:hypothetical protein